MSKVFYRAYLYTTINGLEITFQEYFVIKETRCYYFCVNNFWLKNSDNPIREAKKNGIKVSRIQKEGSRIAFETKELAFENLRFRTTYRIGHLERELKFKQTFLDKMENKSLSELEQYYSGYIIPDTKELTNSYYNFDY